MYLLYVATVGAVVRDHEGRAIYAAAQFFSGVEDVIKAKFLAILLGLKGAAARGIKITTVESDALLVIREIKDNLFLKTNVMF